MFICLRHAQAIHLNHLKRFDSNQSSFIPSVNLILDLFPSNHDRLLTLTFIELIHPLLVPCFVTSSFTSNSFTSSSILWSVNHLNLIIVSGPRFAFSHANKGFLPGFLIQKDEASLKVDQHVRLHSSPNYLLYLYHPYDDRAITRTIPQSPIV